MVFPNLTTPSNCLAVRVGDNAATWNELSRLIGGYVTSLEAAGVGEGERVGVWAQPHLGTVVAMVGNLISGRVTVPLNPKLGPRELKHIHADAKPVHTFDPGKDTIAPGEPWTPRALPETRPALILYTSGTTGAPKGAVLTAANIIANVDALAAAWKWTDSDTVVHALPLFHVHGLVLGVFGSLRAGGAVHIVPKFYPSAIADALAAGGTMLFAVPTMHRRIGDALASGATPAAPFTDARVLISGSAGLPQSEHARLEKLIGRRIHERYGLTETLINCATRVDESDPVGTVGPALGGIELKLVDDARNPVSPGELGEVVVRGENIFAGYLNRPDATTAVRDDDGWFYTGDIASQDPSGSIRIVGRRATDLIKTGGFKVGAGEVESVLLDHPTVRDVAVVGRPDPDLGEHIVAFIVSDNPAPPEQYSEWVASELSPHKRPRVVRFIDALPRNAMGKVQKKNLP